MTSHPLADMGKFGTIVVDPPWAFSYSTRKSESGNNGWRGSTDRHYRNMTLSELETLPVPEVACDDSVLWLWSVNALLDNAFDLMRAPTYRPGDIAMVDGSVHVLDGAGYFTCIETGEVIIADESTSCGPVLGNVADIAELRGAAQAFLDAYDAVGIEVWWPDEVEPLREVLER